MIEKRFAFHTPTANGKNFIDSIRAYVSDLYRHIEAFVPNSREKSIALTKLEEVSMWAIKGVVMNDPDSKMEDNAAMEQVDMEMNGEATKPDEHM